MNSNDKIQRFTETISNETSDLGVLFLTIPEIVSAIIHWGNRILSLWLLCKSLNVPSSICSNLELDEIDPPIDSTLSYQNDNNLWEKKKSLEFFLLSINPIAIVIIIIQTFYENLKDSLRDLGTIDLSYKSIDWLQILF